jgi:D-alanyl-lipoteichoic acid acyltransferase DltB (MBOAT superfamily)
VLFNTYEFVLLFLPVALVGYHWLGRSGRRELAFLWIAALSLLLYGWWEPRHVMLLLGSVAFNYGVGVALSRRPSRVVLALGVIANLACLGYYKYTYFIVWNLNGALGTSFETAEILLPAAISFFTFQQIAYIADAYRGLTKEYSPLRYLLFVTFFPQLVIGPIVHHSETMPQFARPGLFESLPRNLSIGLTIFVIGLFKKVVLGDVSGLYADQVFNAAEAGTTLGMLDAWVGTVAFSFQIYFDFSGYSDMAIGLGRMFGIRLPQNFDSPYKACDITDFWQRWHVTLTRFIRDYIYIPLSHGSPERWRRYLNVLVVMFIAGLWHGAGWLFVLWGFTHGVYLVIQKLWRHRTGPLRPRFAERPAYRWGCRILLFVCCSIAWVPFRADSSDAMLRVLRGMFSGIAAGPLWESLRVAGPLSEIQALFLPAGTPITAFPGQPLVWLAVLLAVVWLWPNTQQVMGRYRPALGFVRSRTPNWLEWRPLPVWSVAMGLLFLVSTLWMSQTVAFIYFQF